MSWDWSAFLGGGLYGLGKNAYDNGKGWFNGRSNVPQIPQNPYLGNYNSLIGQLTQQANGQGPSVSQGVYQQAHDTGMHDVQSMARGGSAGAARAGMQQMGNMNMNLAQGYSNARLQEQLNAQQALSGVLGGASNAWFQPQSANLQATMGTQTNGQQLLALLQQLTQSGATLAQKGATAGAGGV